MGDISGIADISFGNMHSRYNNGPLYITTTQISVVDTNLYSVKTWMQNKCVELERRTNVSIMSFQQFRSNTLRTINLSNIRTGHI